MTTKTDVDPMQETVNAASRLARSVAGDDDASFMRTFQAVLNTAQTAMAGGDPQPATRRRAAASGRRAAAARPGAARTAGGIPPDSVYSDPVFLANAHALLSNRRRIVGGVPATAFADCVAVGSAAQWCCTGTLIAPNVVVTAGHCDRGGCGDRIFVGTDVDDPNRGHIVKVRERHTHPGYRPPRDQDDVAVLVLDRSVDDVTPRAIATAAALRRLAPSALSATATQTRVARPVTGCAASSTCHSPHLTRASAAIRGPSSWPAPRSSTRTAATGTAVGLPTSTSAVHGCSPEPPRGRRRAPFGPVATEGSTPPSTPIASGWRRSWGRRTEPASADTGPRREGWAAALGRSRAQGREPVEQLAGELGVPGARGGGTGGRGTTGRRLCAGPGPASPPRKRGVLGRHRSLEGPGPRHRGRRTRSATLEGEARRGENARASEVWGSYPWSIRSRDWAAGRDRPVGQDVDDGPRRSS